MIEKFDVSREHGIPIVAIAGPRLILDTGSPVSLARNGNIMLGGSEHQVRVDCWARNPDSLSELLGGPVDGLLGCDLLAGRILDLDCAAGHAHIISDDASPDTPWRRSRSVGRTSPSEIAVPLLLPPHPSNPRKYSPATRQA